MKRLRILFVSHAFPPHFRGGAEISTALLIDELAKQHECTVIVPAFQKEPWRRGPVTVYPLLRNLDLQDRTPGDIARYGKDILFGQKENQRILAAFLAEHPVDVIHIIPSSTQFVSLAAAAVASGKPVVMDVRDYSLICPASFQTWRSPERGCEWGCLSCLIRRYHPRSLLLRIGIPFFACYELLVFRYFQAQLRRALRANKRVAIVNLTRYVQERMVRAGFPAARMHVIPNISPRVKPIRATRGKRLLYVGALEKNKGVWDAIEAFRMVSMEAGASGYTLDIVGPGSQDAAIRAYIKEHGLPITVHGKLPHETVLQLYQKATLVLAPSVWPEPFGRYILDAMATQTPLIATRVGGVPELIDDGKTGILVPPADPAALAQAIHVMLTDPKGRARLGKNLAAQAGKYSAAVIAAQRLAVYRSLLGGLRP